MAKASLNMGGDAFMPEFWPANKLIGELEHVLIEAKQIIGQLTSDQIESLAAEKVIGLLTSEQIAELSAAKIAGQLTNAQIESLETAKLLGQIKETQIAEGAITTNKLAANSVTASKILAEQIEAKHLKIGSVTAEKLAVGSVTASKIAVENLSAISANLGTVTAGKLTAVEIEAVKKLTLKQGSEGELGKEAGSEIQWLSGETVRHSISSRFNAVSKGLKLELASIGSKNTSALIVEASDSTELKGGIRAEPKAGISATILTPEERSDFLRLPGTAKRKVVSGWVTKEGALEAGEGFSVKKEGVGLYLITFSKEMTLKPSLTITPSTSAFQPVFATNSEGKNSFKVQFWNQSSTAAENCAFSFTAVG